MPESGAGILPLASGHASAPRQQHTPSLEAHVNKALAPGAAACGFLVGSSFSGEERACTQG